MFSRILSKTKQTLLIQKYLYFLRTYLFFFLKEQGNKSTIKVDAREENRLFFNLFAAGIARY